MEVNPETEEKKESLWGTFLSDAAKAPNNHSAATIIVCGEKGNPFAEIIHSMKSSSSIGRPEEQLPYFLNYRYVEADSAIDEALNLHTWTVQDETHYEQIPTIIPDNHIAEGRLGYILCIDTAKPSTIKTQFQKWTTFISKAQELVFSKLGKSKIQDMKDELSRRLQFYQMAGTENVVDEDEKEAIPLNREKPKRNLGVHITVIVCNTVKFGKSYPQSQAAASKMFEKALLFLRIMSLEIGATIFTFASMQQGALIKQYLDSVVLGQKLTQEPQIANIILQELKDEQVFIPSGFDTETLLANTSLVKQKKKFEEVFKKKAKKKSQEVAEFKNEAEWDDKHFLSLLRFRIKEVTEDRAKRDQSGEKAQIGQRYMHDQLLAENGTRIPDIRRRSSMRKPRKSGRGHTDLSRTAERERRNRLTYKALNLIKPG